MEESHYSVNSTTPFLLAGDFNVDVRRHDWSSTAWNQPADGKGDLPSIHSKTQLPVPLPEPEQSGSVSFKDILQRMSDIEVSMEDMNSSINEILERIRGRSGPSNSESGRKASSGASSSASSSASETSDSDDDDSASTGASSATESDDESRPESPATH
ncbi:uncharacterized protein LOC144139606 [Haemaphysalis longicornis]